MTAAKNRRHTGNPARQQLVAFNDAQAPRALGYKYSAVGQESHSPRAIQFVRNLSKLKREINIGDIARVIGVRERIDMSIVDPDLGSGVPWRAGQDRSK